MLGRNFNIQRYNGSEYVCVSWSGVTVVAMCGTGREEGFIFRGGRDQRESHMEEIPISDIFVTHLDICAVAQTLHIYKKPIQTPCH